VATAKDPEQALKGMAQRRERLQIQSRIDHLGLQEGQCDADDLLENLLA
jgi:hypothetical protein